MKKALNITMGCHPDSGGVYTSVVDFTEALGCDILNFGSDSPDKPLGIQGQFYGLPARKFAPRKTALYLPRTSSDEAKRIAKNYRLWIGHVLYLPHLIWMCRHSKSLGTPYWAVAHGGLDPYVFRRIGWAKEIWLRLYGFPYLSGAKRVLFSTRRELEKASEHYRGDNMHWLYWPTRPIDLSEKISKRKAFRERYSIPEDARLLLYLGRLHSIKRPLETIQAFLNTAPNEGRLLLVGMDGDLKVDTLRKRYSSHPRVLIIGPLFGDDKNSAYCAADGFVSLSFKENFGYTTAEAATAGLPMILSPGNDLGHDFPESCRWLLSDDSRTVCDAAFQAFFDASVDELQLRGKAGRDWATRELSFERFTTTIRNWMHADLKDAFENS